MEDHLPLQSVQGSTKLLLSVTIHSGIKDINRLERAIRVNNKALSSLDMRKNNIRAEGGKTLSEALHNNITMKNLNIAGNKLSEDESHKRNFSGINAICNIIPTMHAMITINMVGNKIGKEGLSKLQEVMQTHPTLVSLCGIAEDATEADLSGLGMDVDDAAVLADEIPAKGSLEKLNISDNKLACKAGGDAISSMLQKTSVLKELDISKNTGFSNCNPLEFANALVVGLRGTLTKIDISNNHLQAEGSKAIASALKDNNVLKEMNIASNSLGYKTFRDGGIKADTSGVIAICDAITTMEALVKFDISNNSLMARGGQYLAYALMEKIHNVMTELNISANMLAYNKKEHEDMSGLTEINKAIHTMSVIKSVNILDNRIGTDQARIFASTLEEHPTLKSLCGNNGDETELDMSGDNTSFINMRAEGVIMLAPEIMANKALTKLRMDKNSIYGAEAGKALSDALTDNNVLQEINLSDQGYSSTDFALNAEFMKEFKVGANTSKALKILNISNNNLLTKEAGKILADMLDTNSTLEELDVSSNSWKDEFGQFMGDSQGFACALADGIKKNEKIRSLNISDNRIGDFVVTPEIWKTGFNFAGQQLFKQQNTLGNWTTKPPSDAKPKGLQAIADAIQNNVAMEKLNMSKNNIRGDEGICALCEALRKNTVLKEINLSYNSTSLRRKLLADNSNGDIRTKMNIIL